MRLFCESHNFAPFYYILKTQREIIVFTEKLSTGYLGLLTPK